LYVSYSKSSRGNTVKEQDYDIVNATSGKQTITMTPNPAYGISSIKMDENPAYRCLEE